MDEIKEKLIQELTPNILSMEIIEKEKLDLENVFEIKIGPEIIGPFSGPFLKTFFAGKETDNLMVKNLESIIWIPLQQHAFFFAGEAKPIVIPESERREFYLLVNGRKIGPYKIEDIEYKFKNGELLFTDLISEDEGNHWYKLYEMAHVDLRRHIGSELPPTPTKIDQTPNIVSNVQEQIGIVGDLAKAGLEGEKEKSKRFADFEQGGSAKKKSAPSKLTTRLILLLIVVAGFYFMGRQQKEEPGTVSSEMREPTAVTPKKSKTRKMEMEKIPYRARTERVIEERKNIRPPRYPMAPALTPINSETESTIDELPQEPDEEIIDDELPNPKKPVSPRRRSRPKPFEDQVDEPVDDVIDE